MVKLLVCKGSLRERFERFWGAYPRRRPNPRALAEHEFVKLVRGGVEASVLIAAAARFAAECHSGKVEASYIPHARTWLAQARYLDYVEGPPVSDAPGAPPAERAWDPLLGHQLLRPVRGEVGEVAYATWIAPLDVHLEDGVATLLCRSAYEREWARGHYAYAIRRALARVASEIRWEIRS
jgi:hypothetical protein